MNTMEDVDTICSLYGFLSDSGTLVFFLCSNLDFRKRDTHDSLSDTKE